MEFGLFQQQTTSLVMTNELRQAISLLQYSTVDLAAFIEEQALENPLIELKDRSDRVLSEHIRMMREERPEGEGTLDWSQSSPFDYLHVERLNLSDYLIQQARDLPLNKNEFEWLCYFIYSLRDDGYLSRSLHSLQADLGLTDQEAEKTLYHLQHLEPAGIGARSLQECLLLQLQRKKQRDPLAETIVEHYMELLAEKRWKMIADDLQISLADVQRVYDCIQQLDPRPGSQIGGEPTNYLVPDVTIDWVEGELTILLQDDYLPKITLNRQYQTLLTDGEGEAAQYAKEKYHQMQWLVKSIQQRQQTLLKVTEAILRKQRAFFEEKEGALQPLTLREVAEEIGVHESTVSRATTNKYAQTPRGLLELKSFFVSSISSRFGEKGPSSDSVKKLVRKLVEEENKAKPLSDQKIAHLLKDQYNVEASRRVIAKYRDELGIPSSTKRKRYG
ncbi:RNA polymerase factor sigma-54 [Halalkalibacterium halodurans]|jgi:RNA polymerase sigma-54 factor|uniref:RNA polymerase sigma factor (Sigma54) n=2 Tax=Halalkalibacterium halodurans TaxID=86665 RepID=Q9K710_HALH5|nr:RNA polymerase factor sigma-54 [Halalkalibacterium halodurans]MDY7224042.1 RNA polymerase factor sigma-54 [Halalkalibacterium halodurans]MDY7243327.1 RNA polymerase factor sigma-54 [Halalkalibacterium halodurans]MED4080191.1 RNA polymerase factor sigma-54 [Halalkalibacterium halodurans]MED4083414.1 RNA polymerase factor sigma-54 [Halalkalibacterium halodurans]MED4105156.1 RNA polymerase factor sigma-54 [Halalkalibacterium halodurans]